MVISVCKWYNVKKRTVTFEESRKGRGHMNRLEDMIAASKLNELLHKKDDEKAKNTLLWVLAVVGAVAAIAGIAYAVYKFFTPVLEDSKRTLKTISTTIFSVTMMKFN